MLMPPPAIARAHLKTGNSGCRSRQIDATTRLAETAQRYLARGWCIFPLRARSKRPLLSWDPLQRALPSVEQVIDWFSRWPDANIGIVTGEISNLVVLDIDPKHGGDASLERLDVSFQ
jgi:hypothetical protein